jgi:hypothetical protein
VQLGTGSRFSARAVSLSFLVSPLLTRGAPFTFSPSLSQLRPYCIQRVIDLSLPQYHSRLLSSLPNTFTCIMYILFLSFASTLYLHFPLFHCIVPFFLLFSRIHHQPLNYLYEHFHTQIHFSGLFCMFRFCTSLDPLLPYPRLLLLMFLVLVDP